MKKPAKTTYTLIFFTIFFSVFIKSYNLFAAEFSGKNLELESNSNKLSVHLIAPGSMTKENVVKEFQKILKNEGFNTVLPEGAISNAELSSNSVYANLDKKRLEFFIRAFESKDDIIWCLRGGFGSQYVLREFVFYAQNILKKEKKPSFKLLCGYSDITHLGLGFYCLFGWPYLHAQVYYCKETFSVSKIDTNCEASIKDVTSILEGKTKSVCYKLQPMNPLAKEATIENSTVCGGNASIIQRNINGLLKEIDWDNKILFIEDTLEYDYRTKDILYGLFDTGRFNKVKGIIFGDMPFNDNCKTEDFIKDFFNNYLDCYNIKVPLYYYPRIGHGDFNDPLPIGTSAKIGILKNSPYLTVDADFSKWLLKE